MNLRYTLYFCLCLLASPAWAQEVYAPEKFSEAINSPYPEFNPKLSPDGSTLFFVRANHPENTYGTHDTQDIWYSTLQEDESWSEARRMPDHLNRNRYNAVLSVYNQGNSLLLLGRYNKKGNIWKKRGFSVSHKKESGWGKPQPLKVKKFARKSKGLFTTASISDDGQYLVINFNKRYNSKKNSMYMSRLKKNGKKYTKPRKIRNLLPAEGTEEAPFLSADGKRLYFTSNLTGNHQVYRADRLDNSGRVWSTPKSVGDSVNSLAWDSYFSTNLNESFGYFASNRKASGPDLYSIKLIEEHPFILVKGRVLNPRTNEPLSPETKVSFLANQEAIDSVSYNPAEGTYQAYLPLGGRYEIKAEAYSHKQKADSVDATGLIEYTETALDLFLEPILVARIEGQLLIRSSNTPVPAAANPQILVDGQKPDSVYLDPINNRYQLWLPYGKDYQVKVQVTGFDPEIENLKLSHIDGYKEITKNLFVDTKKMASISGVIYDKKTGKPFSSDVPVKIILNDSIEANISLEGESSRFSLQLPLGTRYVINAKAEGYYAMFESVDLSQEEENVKVLKDLYLAPIEVGQSFRINNIFFETGKAQLKTESFQELDRVVTFLEENPKMKIEIAGHTDNVGSAASNKKLSTQRAKAVADYITTKGVDETRITFRGYGSSKPEADNSTELGKSMNRRVEFTILEIVK
jgi:outer membrane protein OmpA-like peptidoglycan-associated protein